MSRDLSDADALSRQSLRVEDWLLSAAEKLASAKLPDAYQEALCLLSIATDLSVEVLIREKKGLLNALPVSGLVSLENRLSVVLERRLTHEPMAYIRGSKAFCNHDYYVCPGVLIPRPETEHLIDCASSVISALDIPKHRCLVVDVGFGSGVIPLEIRALFPEVAIVAWDCSQDAYDCARQNASLQGVTDIEWRHKDFFDDREAFCQLVSEYDHCVLCSNPPYISEAAYLSLDPDVRLHEPKEALVPGPLGDEIYVQLLSLLNGLGVTMVFEIGYDQENRLRSLCEESSASVLDVITDLQGHSRILLAESNTEVNDA